MIPNIGTEVGSDTRNIINTLIDVVNGQSNALQDLVIKGQLTEEQYQNLLITLNGLIKKGEVTVNDLNVEEGKITGEYIADELINRIKASETLSKENQEKFINYINGRYRDWETDRKSTRLNSSHRSLSRMPSSA